ncbi:glycosyltransferase family 4 protein [Spirosoma endophyticum]|uniref:Glycosyltransferase involved in cell wall bisynthesis n=1 Tax=Spirosoma endophyticum TaxID=662367 RepID=A0A1I2I7Q3_9BACT|nr:glycosyltransferase family 4 protein [Spirosoma endophyticum]SFF37658.1 Glycosyltransferase involved in cell wall bisynthesis [Spirosoma endophyticum]
MDGLKLNICSNGDPKSPKTWSGTPYNLYSELINNDALGEAFDSNVFDSKYKSLLPKLVSKFYYGSSIGEERTSFHRYVNAERVRRKTSSSHVPSTLHTSTLDLPFAILPKDQKHYLYCDSTWNLWSSHSTAMDGYSKKLLVQAEKLEQRAYQQMAHIFSISEYVKNNLVDHYKINSNNITVVGTGLGVIKPFYGEKNYSNKKILFAAKGRFEDKGGYLVLEAFKKVLEFNPDIELLIVGQNDYTKTIKLPNVRTFGFIAIDELQSIFNECSLFLMPAINEPWGLVYLEALSCKMPIIGLNKNSFPEISGYGKYGFGLDTNNPEDLARLIIKLFEDNKKLKEIGQEAQEYCLNKFSWQKTVSTILSTIEKTEK